MTHLPRILVALLSLVLAGNGFAERTIADIAYPITLLGTEMEGESDGGEPTFALVANRAEIIQGAYPESYVAAVAAPVRFALAGEGFPSESNIVVLSKIKLESEWGEKEHALTIDASGMINTQEELSMTPEQVLKIVVKAVQRTLAQNATGDDKKKPVRVIYKLPEGLKVAGLPEVLKLKSK